MSNRLYQAYLLLMPLALFLLKLDKYDLIISFESGPAKGIKKNIRTNIYHMFILLCVIYGTCMMII